MRFSSIVGVYCCAASTIGEIRIDAHFLSKMNMGFGRPMLCASQVYERLVLCAFNSLDRVGSLVSSPLVPLWMPAFSFPGRFWSNYYVSTSSFPRTT